MSKSYLDNDTAQNQSFWQLYRLPILIFGGITLICLIVIGTQIYLHYQELAAAEAAKKVVRALRKEAIEAEANDDLNKAEDLYTKGVYEAAEAKSKMDVLEFLSRLVQVQIKEGKLGDTKDFVQMAVTLACKLKGTPDAHSNLPIWLDDMANAFYKRGEHSEDEKVKEFCLERYLDIKLPTEDHFDPFLKGRSDLLNGHLGNEGRYLESVPYTEKYCDWDQRTHPDDMSITPGKYLQLGALYLMAHKTQEADLASKKFSDLNKGFKNSLDEVLANVYFGQVCEQQNKLQEAENLYKKALQQCAEYKEPPSYTGRCFAVLALLEQKLGNTAEASKLFQESLDCYDKSLIVPVTGDNEFLHPDGWVYSGRVFSLEHLSEIASKEGNTSLSQSLKAKATKIRDKNPHWALCKNPDPNYFYVVRGYFPFPLETIPTRIKFSF